MDQRTPDSLFDGATFVDLSHWRKIAVSGGDTFVWLNSLITADIEDLGPGRARRSLLLSPTGRVRAEFTVTVPRGTVVLVQDPEQPRSILDLLTPYVLSSDVELEDRTLDLGLLAFPRRETLPVAPGAAFSRPSVLGPGVDVILLAEDHRALSPGFAKSYRTAGNEELEAWRIAAGLPRVGIDVTEEDLPQESRLEEAVSFDKGCFLGQEAVAKVRNLGHPRRVLLSLEADRGLSPGDPIMVNGDEVGRITSASATEIGSVSLGRVKWDARMGPFRTAGGQPLRVLS
jgi:tRNA-modifying protein YgfZ